MRKQACKKSGRKHLSWLVTALQPIKLTYKIVKVLPSFMRCNFAIFIELQFWRCHIAVESKQPYCCSSTKKKPVKNNEGTKYSIDVNQKLSNRETNLFNGNSLSFAFGFITIFMSQLTLLRSNSRMDDNFCALLDNGSTTATTSILARLSSSATSVTMLNRTDVQSMSNHGNEIKTRLVKQIWNGASFRTQ